MNLLAKKILMGKSLKIKNWMKSILMKKFFQKISMANLYTIVTLSVNFYLKRELDNHQRMGFMIAANNLQILSKLKVLPFQIKRHLYETYLNTNDLKSFKLIHLFLMLNRFSLRKVTSGNTTSNVFIRLFYIFLEATWNHLNLIHLFLIRKTGFWYEKERQEIVLLIYLFDYFTSS